MQLTSHITLAVCITTAAHGTANCGDKPGQSWCMQGDSTYIIKLVSSTRLFHVADMQPVDPGGDAWPLPANGRAVAVHAGRTAAALLELPVAATRDACAAELPPVVWLTLGLLATDGLVLQARAGALEMIPLHSANVAGAHG